MKRKLHIILALIATLSAYHVDAQELPLLSQRVYDALYINPGVVGARASMEVTAHHRSQWVGFAGAPHTQIVSINAPVGKRLGLGGFVLSDISGPSQNLGFGLSYGFHIPFKKNNIGLGLTAGMMRYQFDGGVLNMPDLGDPLWQGISLSSRWTPEFAVGAFVYNRRRYIGFSYAQLVSIVPASITHLELKSNQRINLIAGYDVLSTKEVVLTPSVFISATPQPAIISETGLTASFFDLFLLGTYYRLKDAFIILAGVKVMKNISVAYSYDYSYTGLGSYSSGSHEVVIQVAVNARQRMVCPVYRKLLDKKRNTWKY